MLEQLESLREMRGAASAVAKMTSLEMYSWNEMREGCVVRGGSRLGD